MDGIPHIERPNPYRKAIEEQESRGWREREFFSVADKTTTEAPSPNPPGRISSICAYGATARNLATTAAVYALSFGPTGVRRALNGDMDSIANIIVHLANSSLPALKTNERLKNRHHLAKHLTDSL